MRLIGKTFLIELTGKPLLDAATEERLLPTIVDVGLKGVFRRKPVRIITFYAVLKTLSPSPKKRKCR